MASRFIFIVLMVASLLAFQNCAQAPGGLAGGTEMSAAQKLESRTFLFTDDYGRVGTGASELELNVESGEISFAAESVAVQSSLSAPSTKYCLDDDERTELDQLLNEDQVCASERGARSDAVCTAIYRPAYARYGSQTQSLVPVGEAVSGCFVKADFCSGKGERIRQIIEQVKASLDSRVCPQI